MSLLDTLRKLGILRFGAKSAVYTKAEDRPMEFVADGVFDAEKDLTNIDLTKKEEETEDADK